MDIGSEGNVNFSDMFKYIMFGEVPILATKYCLIDIQPSDGKDWPEKIVKYCSEEIVRKQCTIEVHKAYKIESSADAPLPCRIIPKEAYLDLAATLIKKKPDDVQSAEPQMTERQQFEIEQERSIRTRSKSDEPVKIDSQSLHTVDDFKKCFELNKVTPPLFSKYSDDEDDKDEPKTTPFDVGQKRDPLDKKRLKIDFTKQSVNKANDDICKEIEAIESHFSYPQIEKKVFSCRVLQIVNPKTVLVTYDPKGDLHERLCKYSVDIKRYLDKFKRRMQPGAVVEKNPCVLRCDESELFMRGVVLMKSMTTSEVLLVDQAKVSTVRNDFLYECPPEIQALPLLCLKLKLNLEVKGRLRATDLCTEMAKYLTEKKPLLYAKVRGIGDTPIVDLYDDFEMKTLVYDDAIKAKYFTK